MFDNATVSAVVAIAARLNVEPAALLAVAQVESAGKAFARVGGRDEPLIRFEGHYFDRRLSGDELKAARAKKLASPKAGAIPNPANQADRWKLLNRAAEINAQAAYESVSWGVGQVMGAHWKWLGFKSVTELVNLCRRDVAGQIEIMVRYIEKAKLVRALKAKDWAAFADGYNGPDYAKHGYHTKIGKAYAVWAKKGVTPAPVAKPEPAAPVAPPAPLPKPTPVKDMAMSKGDSGPVVEELQKNLNTLGFDLVVTGIYDDPTEDAVTVFQLANKDLEGKPLVADGMAGGRTTGAIAEALLRPALKEAQKTVPPSATKEVKEKFNVFKWAWGVIATFGAAILSWFASLEWQQIVAVFGGIVVLLILIVVGERWIVGALKRINEELSQ